MSARRKKTFPPGTFLPFPQRLAAILQLCIAFSLLFWYLFQPFMGEYFELRSRLLVYEYAMGTSDIVNNKIDQTATLNEHNMFRFAQLSDEQKEPILNDYHHIHHYTQRSVWNKFGDGIKAVLLDVPPFEMAWIVFSITIAILLLLKVEGAWQAAWLIPLIATAYIADNQISNIPTYQSPDLSIFPSEQLLIDQFIEEPFAINPLVQKMQLEKGWTKYLATNWSEKEDPQEGEFNFTIARLSKLHNEPIFKWTRRHNEKIGGLSALVFLSWSLYFAWISSRAQAKEQRT